MNILAKYIALVLALLFDPLATVQAGTITKTHAFISGSAISSSAMNTNFDQLFTEVNAKESRIASLESSSSTQTTAVTSATAQLALRIPILVTATVASYTFPSGATSVLIEATGGSGGGGGRFTFAAAGGTSKGGSGGNGGYFKSLNSLPAGGSLSITIGAAGALGADTGTPNSCGVNPSATDGGAGGNTTVHILDSGAVTLHAFTAYGGLGGTGASRTASCMDGSDGAGGKSINGDFNLQGSPGTGGAGATLANGGATAGLAGKVLLTFY